MYSNFMNFMNFPKFPLVALARKESITNGIRVNLSVNPSVQLRGVAAGERQMRRERGYYCECLEVPSLKSESTVESEA
jgi:hypothetical protein